MRTVIIIPARMASRRLPGKPLAELGGVPLVVRVAQQAKGCPNADAVVIATDSLDIVAAAKRHGCAVQLTATTHNSGSARVAEAALALGADWVLNVQGDEPFVDPRDLQDMVQFGRAHPEAIVTLKRPLHSPAELHDPNVVKVVCRNDHHALYFSRAAVPWGENAPSFGHIGVYGCSRTVLQRWQAAPPQALERCERLEQLRALAIGLPIVALPARTEGRGIDTPADLAWARQQLAELGLAAFARPLPGEMT